MARKGTLTVRVVADTAAAEKGLDRFNTQVSNTGDKLQAAGKKMTMFATVPIVGAMGLATKAAGDLEQAVGGTEAVFGDAADAVEDFAKTAPRAIGLTEAEFRDATTSIGGQLKRMTGDVDLAAEQSVELTKVAADLAATYGGTTAEAVQALGSAFRGEADPAERFNLNLKIGAVNAKAVEMGLAATTSEVDDNARAQATLALIMEQSADAQGQFAREADSANGSMQIARAEIGQAAAEIGANLLPVVSDAAGGVADFASAFGSLPDPVQRSVIGLGLLVAAAGPVTGAVGSVINGIDKARDAASKASGAFETMQLRSLYLSQSLGGPAGLAAGLGAVGAVVATGAVLYGDYAKTKAEARRITDLYVDALKSENDELDENIDKVGASELANKDYATALRESGVGFDVLLRGVRESGDAVETLDDSLAGMQAGIITLEEAIENAGLSGTELGDALLTLNGQMSAGNIFDLINDLDGLSDRYDNATEKSKNQAAATGDVTEATKDAAGAADDAKGPTEELGEAAEDAATSEDRLADAIRGVNDALTAQFDPLFAARDALRRNQEAQWKVQEATDAVTEAQRHYNDVEAEFGRKSPEAQYAYHQLEDANRRLADAKYDTAEAALDATTATNNLAARMRAGEVDIVAAKNTLNDWVQQGLITEDQANQVAGELDNVAQQAANLEGRSVHIPVTADVSAFERSIADLYRERDGIRISVGGGGGIPLRARGGPVSPRSPYIVGEEGPELFVPNQAGQVMSNRKTGQMVNSGGAVINVNLSGGDHDASSIASHIAWMLAGR